MKKTVLVFALFLSVALCMSAAAVPASAMTAGEGFRAFTDSLRVYDQNLMKLLGNRPDGVIDDDDVIPMDPVAFLEGGQFWAVLQTGGNDSEIDKAKKEHGIKAIKYTVDGSKFKIAYTEQNGWKVSYEGTYDETSDAMNWRFKQTDGNEKLLTDIKFEYRRTDFGYVARLYDFGYTAVHKMAIKDGDGAVGWDFDEGAQDEPLPRGAGLEYPKTCRTWYDYDAGAKKLGFKPLNSKPKEFSVTWMK